MKLKPYKYWRQLELFSLTTFMNIVTFIQFAIIPLTRNTLNENGESDSVSSNLIDPIVTLLLEPFDFINTFMNIAAPLRLLLFSYVIMGIIYGLVVSFFYPSYRLFVLLADMLFPLMFGYGCVSMAIGHLQNRDSIIVFITLGALYLAGRIVLITIPRAKNWANKWVDKTSLKITAIFFARLRKTETTLELDDKKDGILKEIRKDDPTIQFDDQVTKLRNIMEIVVVVIFILFIIVMAWIVTPGRLVASLMDKENKEAFNYFVRIFLVALLVFGFIRLITAIFYMLKFKQPFFLKLKRLAFQGCIALAGLTLMPVLNMILNATNTEKTFCPPYNYYDYETNQTTFLAYFTNRESGCKRCTYTSYHNLQICYDICFYEEGRYAYTHASSAVFISEEDMSQIYVLPVAIIEIYFLVVFLQLVRSIFVKTKRVVEFIPAPTQSNELKFLSVIDRLKSKGVYIFTSYRYSHSLYYFNFNQAKNFVLFFTSLFPIFPIVSVREQSDFIVCLLFVLTSLTISILSFLIRPYRSIIHNAHNGVTYFVAAISSAVALVKTKGVYVPKSIGDALIIVIIVLPFIVVFIVPIFAKPDKTCMSVPYDILEIVQKNKYIKSDAYKKSLDDISEAFDTDSESLINIDQLEDDNNDTQVADFHLRTIAPIHVQAAIDSGLKGYTKAISQTYVPTDIDASDFNRSVDEMCDVADKLLDTMAFNGLDLLLMISLTVCGICSGWAFAAGVNQWLHNDGVSSIKCDWTNLSLVPDLPIYARRNV